ncbi:MAG: (Fe-S)-binding protein [Desulfobacterales bacterium]|nr:(Fe-S)-binding protein [Desulfobacterales bacterium]
MAIEDYKDDMMACVRCSSCKWVPFNNMKSSRFAKNCPSINKFNFHSYSGSGRLNVGLSVLEGRSELTENVSEIIFKCQLCGACDTACKSYREVIDLTEVLLELRSTCVEEGQLLLEHMDVIHALKQEDNMLGEPKAERGKWAEGLDLKDINKEQVDVIFHAGCRYSYDLDLRDIVRGAVKLMISSGVDVGIAGREESCCGGRAYEMGYQGEARNFAEDVQARVKASGAGTLVTACSDGYATFKYLYPRMGIQLSADVLHITQYFARLIEEGRLKLTNDVPIFVTYHDPCHLGRMGEPFIGDWQGDKRERLRSMNRTGKYGEYEAPRKLLKSIPGLELLEMERIREYSWCCGAGGGVYDAFPDFAAWTAVERLEEAVSTGADALVTACPWCERVFRDGVRESGLKLDVYDVNELLLRAAGI